MNAEGLLSQSKTISLLLPIQTQEQDMQDAFLLACGLKKLGKQVFVEHEQTALPNSSQKEKTFAVALKGLAPWIARVRYEKDAKDLKLYFTLNQGEVSPEALSLQMQDQADLTIIVEGEGALNNGAPISSGRQLSAREAKKHVLELLCRQEDSQTRLLGQVLGSLEYVSRLDLYLMLLDRQSFQSMRVQPKGLPLLIPELREDFGGHSSYLFFFDSSHGAQGLLWSSSSRVRTKFRDSTGGQQKGFWVLMRPTPLSSEQLKYAFLS